MTNTAELEVLILAIKGIREKTKPSQYDVIDSILTEVIETRDKVMSNEFRVSAAIKTLNETYMTIQAY